MGTNVESQEVRYCTAADGVKLAYALEGAGPPLMYIGLFTYTVDFPRDPSILGLRIGLARERTVVGFDRHGVGPSQRQVPQLSMGSANFNARWDLVPGKGPFLNTINLQDMAAIVILAPPMLNGARALNGPACPLPSQ